MTVLQTISQKLSVNPAWLWALIQFESNGNPAARNTITGARGLIQFLNSTAQGLGFKSADDLVLKHPSFDSQLKGPVYNYLKQYTPFPTKQSLYMAVFYPVARKWSPGTVFPSNVLKANPGIDTVQSYIDKVDKKTTKPAGAIGIILIVAGIIYLSLNHKE